MVCTKRVITLVWLVHWSSTLIAQDFKTISGKVFDSNTDEPLPFSSVYVDGTSIGTITNERGEFRLNIPAVISDDTLIVSHIGYKNFQGVVDNLPEQLNVSMKEAIIDLDEVSVETQRLTAQEIFERVIEKISKNEGYMTEDFRLDGFFREVHSSEGERTGVLECAVEIYDDRVTKDFKNVLIPQFRKLYYRNENKDQFIETKEGHNHLLLILNGGINLIPIGKKYKSSLWRIPLEIEKITYYNDRLVYVLHNKTSRREARMLVDVEDYSVYKNELIIKAAEDDHDNYEWQKVNADGEKCGAIIDHQGYEYRKINGKLFPHYFFRRMDFRCFNLAEKVVSSQAYLSKELLINNVELGIPPISGEKLKKRRAMINRNQPYDSAFWQYFNDIRDVEASDKLTDESIAVVNQDRPVENNSVVQTPKQELKIGDHFTYEFTRADTLFGTLTPDLSCYDVGRYDLDLDVDPEKEWLSGSSRITFRMKEDVDRIRIDLFEGMKLNAVTLESRQVTFKRDLDAVYLNFDDTLQKDSIYAIEVFYEGHPLAPDFDIWASGFMWDMDDEGNEFSQSLCQGYGAKAWWPVKNHLSDESDSTSISITVPSELIAVANGRLINQATTGDKTTYQWKVTNPINNYNISAHIGKYASRTDTLDNLDVSYYYLPQDEELLEEKLELVERMLKVYQRYFGPYPFVEDGFKLVQSPNPMEHQSCVAVGRHWDDQLILHEAAHEWWGNSVSITDNADIWIHEAFATYAESIYIEETLGYQIGQEYLNARKGEVYNDFPLVGVFGMNHFHYRIEDKYFKGALMLNTLRHLVNDDDLWFSVLKDIQLDFRHNFIDTPTLMAFFNDKLEENYTWFFKQYLYTTEVPILVIKRTLVGSEYRWQNISDGFEMTLEFGNIMTLTPKNDWQAFITDLTAHREEIESKYLVKVIEK